VHLKLDHFVNNEAFEQLHVEYVFYKKILKQMLLVDVQSQLARDMLASLQVEIHPKWF